nr:retrovirus-related Pol polyprotein from transposon TNT 1-94 [Tanacetum cinerariifolium]
MSFIRMVKNQNDIKIKQIITNNGTEFRNTELESFCDEKGISQNFSSPYTPKQNGVAKRKNETLILVARTILNGSVFFKYLWTEAVIIACCTQNRSIIVKRHDNTPYEIFRERIPDINYFHVFGCPVFIHNHKDHRGKFNAKADDGWSKDKHIELVNIIGDPGEGMLTRSTIAKLTAASASECLFVDFLFEMEPKKASEALKNKKDKHGIVTKNKARLVTQGYSQEEGIEYNETFTPVARMEATRIFLAFATYMNFTVFQIDVKMKTPMVPPNNLGPDFAGKPINDTIYSGMIGSLMYLTTTRPDIQFFIVLYARYQSNPKESHLTAMKRIFRYLTGTSSLGLYYLKCLGFDIKGYSGSDYASCNMDRKSTSGACQILGGNLVCWSAKKQQLVVMSSAEAEYVAAAGCCAYILWMKSQLSDND